MPASAERFSVGGGMPVSGPLAPGPMQLQYIITLRQYKLQVSTLGAARVLPEGVQLAKPGGETPRCFQSVTETEADMCKPHTNQAKRPAVSSWLST